MKVRQSKPSHSSNQQTWEFLFQTRVAIHNTFTSRGWSPSFAALGNLARRTALRRKRRRFSSTDSSGIWPHRASFNASETRTQARQEKHREHNRTKWRKDSGHVAIAPSLATHVAKAIRKFMHDESWSTILSQGFERHQHVIEKKHERANCVIQQLAAARVPGSGHDNVKLRFRAQDPKHSLLRHAETDDPKYHEACGLETCACLNSRIDNVTMFCSTFF